MSYTSLFLEEFWPSRALLITFWAPVPWVAELMDHVIEPLTFWMSKMIMKIFSMMLWTWVYYCEGFLWKGVMIRCWWLDVGDRISILVTYFECWCPTPTRKEIGCWWQKWPKQFPTSQLVTDTFLSSFRHQHLPLNVSYYTSEYNLYRMTCILSWWTTTRTNSKMSLQWTWLSM